MFSFLILGSVTTLGSFFIVCKLKCLPRGSADFFMVGDVLDRWRKMCYNN